MNKEYYQKYQPVFYQTISNGIKHHKLNHAFLLSGDIFQIKESAIFLAQSIICEDEGLACGSCELCRRVKENLYVDLIVIDASEKMLKKEDVIKVQESFEKTAFEGAAKIYIIHCVDNCMPVTINSLLKMLEEPTSEIYAIFTTTNVEKVLDTVVSRCQLIRIVNHTERYMLEELESRLPKEDASILSKIFYNIDEIETLYNESNYLAIKDLLLEYFQAEIRGKRGMVVIHKGLLTKYNQKNEVELFLNMMIIFYKDVLAGLEKQPVVFVEHQRLLSQTVQSKMSIIKKISVLANAKDRLTSSNMNVSLLFDQIFFQLGGIDNG